VTEYQALKTQILWVPVANEQFCLVLFSQSGFHISGLFATRQPLFTLRDHKNQVIFQAEDTQEPQQGTRR
jgi:hypothetical protein